MFPPALPALHCSCPRKFPHNLAKLQKHSLSPQSYCVTITASEREEVKSLPGSSRLRLSLLRGMKLAAAPSSFSKMTISMISVRLRTRFTKFSVKEEAEHMVFLPALRRWAGSSKSHPNQEQRQRRARANTRGHHLLFQRHRRFSSCFNKHM